MASEYFYNTIKILHPHRLKQSQVDGFEAILRVCEVLTDYRQTAYVLATIHHECAGTMQPIEEYGHGSAYDYGKKLKRGGGPGRRIPYTFPDKLYYGRGFVQLTWYENYEYQGKLLNIDLLNHPELALQPDIAGNILIHGMTHGDFTGHTLDQYINDKQEDFINARKIINGLDQAEKIAAYARVFAQALNEQNITPVLQ